jgi:hypothetical protein
VRTLKWFIVVLGLSLVFLGAAVDSQSRSIEIPSSPGTGADINGLVVRTPKLLSQLTGPESPAQTHEPWNIYGSDLGFTIEHEDKLYVVFGDTWGRDKSEGDDWRSNTMVIVEPDPVHGYVITDVIASENGEAQELLSSLKEPGTEYTVAPTAGISIDGRMYLHYMSINDWDQQWWDYKHPVVNGAGLAYSDDDGKTWTKDETAWWPGDSAFTQAAMVEDDGDIYIFGTPAGRFGPVRLLRVPADELLDPGEYEYWDGEDWSADPLLATEIVPAPVGEPSVRWSPTHERWLMMYKNEVSHAVVLRTAEQLEGPWDAERVVATADEYSSLYAPYLLPIEGPDIYFTISRFNSYQVYVMRFTLEDVSE